MAVAQTKDRSARRRLQEIAAILVQVTTNQVAELGLAVALEDREPPLITTDLDTVRRLVTKGVQHNGRVPELSTLEVARGLAVASELLHRATVELTIDERAGLEWCFSVAADHGGAPQADVRRIEARVSQAMGYEQRITMSPFTPDEIA
jgi:hypothetical protein